MKYFLILFISLTCCAAAPKFHFGDCVKVKEGFYKGCHGQVLYYNTDDTYTVSLNCKNTTTSYDFEEDNLEPTKSCQ